MRLVRTRYLEVCSALITARSKRSRKSYLEKVFSMIRFAIDRWLAYMYDVYHKMDSVIQQQEREEPYVSYVYKYYVLYLLFIISSKLLLFIGIK